MPDEADVGALFRALREDWARHAESDGHRAMVSIANYRVGRFLTRHRSAAVRWLGRKGHTLGLLVGEVVGGVYLERSTEVGEEVHFVHGGGINIHPASRIGDRVGFMHGVTLGTGPDGAAPTIGDDVFIGANASILGGVTVGDGARVAANSLVLKDVPPGTLAIGVPAKNLPLALFD